jgi:hypothetical protein
MILGNIGASQEIAIRRGATWGPHRITFRNPDASPVDLTGASVVAEVRRKTSDSAALLPIDVTIVNAAGGVVDIDLSESATATLTAAEDPSTAASRVVWRLDIIDSAGRVIPVFRGPGTVYL